jgi:hypothetical protein
MQTLEQWQMEFDVLENAREAAQKRYNLAIKAVIKAMEPEGGGVMPPETTDELTEAIKARDRTRAAIDQFVVAIQEAKFP